MEIVSILETASMTMCGIAVILWMAIGTLARFEGGENFDSEDCCWIMYYFGNYVIFTTLHGR